MFWYIGGILAGFAIGYVIAIAQKRGRTTRDVALYKKGVNDCRNCKHMVQIGKYGDVDCKKVFCVLDIPEACKKYRREDETEGDP